MDWLSAEIVTILSRLIIYGIPRQDYHCGDPDWGWSAVYWFQATSNDATFDPRFLIYGDMGNKNGRAVSTLQEEVQTKRIDAVLHVGDFAYDMADVRLL